MIQAIDFKTLIDKSEKFLPSRIAYNSSSRAIPIERVLFNDANERWRVKLFRRTDLEYHSISTINKN